MNTFIANNDHIRKIMCYIVTCSVILCHLIKTHVQLIVAHFITYLCVLATPMTTPFLGLTTKIDLSPALYVLSSYRQPEPSISSISSSGTANQDLTTQSLLAGPTLTGCTINIGFPTATQIPSFTMSTASKDTH